MATTNINGELGRVSYQAIKTIGSKLKLGRIDTGPSIEQGQVVMGVDTPLGRIDKGRQVGSLSDIAPNVPSGYDENGTPSYGDGGANTVTTWAEDRSGGHPDAGFHFNVPSRPQSQKFSDLT